MTNDKIKHDIEQDIIHEEQLNMDYGWIFTIQDENGNERDKVISIPNYKDAVINLLDEYDGVKIVDTKKI